MSIHSLRQKQDDMGKYITQSSAVHVGLGILVYVLTMMGLLNILKPIEIKKPDEKKIFEKAVRVELVSLPKLMAQAAPKLDQPTQAPPALKGSPKATEVGVVKKGVPPAVLEKKTPPAPAQAKTSKPKVAKAPPAKTKAKPAATNERDLTDKESIAKTNADTYKPISISGAVSSIQKTKTIETGGSLVTTKETSRSGNMDTVSSVNSPGQGTALKTAKVSGDPGSLTGVAGGKVTATKGIESGTVTKGTIMTAGIPSDTVVIGSMDADIIRKLLREHIPQFRYCYQRELDVSTKEIQGVVKLVFTIGGTGRVTAADVESSLPTEIKGCVTNVLRGIQFPAPPGGGTVEVKQPINFYPKRL